MNDKKGAMNIGLVLTSLIGIIIIFFFISGALDSLTSAGAELYDVNSSIANESFTITNVSSSYTDLAHGSITESSVYVLNSSNNVVLGAGNFSILAAAGQIALNNGCTSYSEGNCSQWVGSTAKVSYTYTGRKAIPILGSAFSNITSYGFIVLFGAILVGIILFAWYKLRGGR